MQFVHFLDCTRAEFVLFVFCSSTFRPCVFFCNDTFVRRLPVTFWMKNSNWSKLKRKTSVKSNYKQTSFVFAFDKLSCEMKY